MEREIMNEPRWEEVDEATLLAVLRWSLTRVVRCLLPGWISCPGACASSDLRIGIPCFELPGSAAREPNPI
jgi:hypothetical protein